MKSDSLRKFSVLAFSITSLLCIAAGVGFAILNEQLVGGSGGDVGALIVRAVRLQITEPSLYGLPRGTDLILARQDGELHVFARDPDDPAKLMARRDSQKDVREALVELLG